MRYDCVIVGAGAVGASLALALGKLGLNILLLEKKEDVFPPEAFNARTIALSYASACIYETLGLWQHILACAVPIESVQVTVKGQFGSSCLKPEKTQSALGYVVNAKGLESLLIAELTKYNNVTFMRPAELTARQGTPEGWDLTIASLNQAFQCHATLLIAADGAGSTLREEQGISVNTKHYNHFAVLTNVKLEASHPFRAYERFLAQGAIALLPWQNNIATCVWTTQHEQAQFLLSLTDEEFIAACQAEFGFRMGKITQVGKRNCFPLQMTIASIQSSARFLVMGNAAHSLHPIAAQGLNLSLRDIWQVRNQALHLNNKADLGSEDFIAEYHQARSDDQNRIIFATDKIARFMSGGPLPSWLRACGITLFDCANPLKQLFTRFSMGLS